MLPTPKASDRYGAGPHGDGGPNLRTVISLLPTPAVNDMGVSHTPATWDVWTRALAARHGNDGHGASLSIEARRGTTKYTPAIARWELLLGRAAPPMTSAGRLNARFVEWMMGLPDGWVVDVPGMAYRAAITALGNGCVPAQAEAAVRHLLSRVRSTHDRQRNPDRDPA